MVEDQEQENEDDLVEELTPSLHQESRSDLATTVKAILFGRDLAGTDRVFHTGCGSHWIFTTNTDAVEEQRPCVADDPAVLVDTPSSSKHEKTDEHDSGILNETPATTNPVTNDTDEDLTNNDTDDFEIGESVEPGRAANGRF